MTFTLGRDDNNPRGAPPPTQRHQPNQSQQQRNLNHDHRNGVIFDEVAWRVSLGLQRTALLLKLPICCVNERFGATSNH